MGRALRVLLLNYCCAMALSVTGPTFHNCGEKKEDQISVEANAPWQIATSENYYSTMNTSLSLCSEKVKSMYSLQESLQRKHICVRCHVLFEDKGLCPAESVFREFAAIDGGQWTIWKKTKGHDEVERWDISNVKFNHGGHFAGFKMEMRMGSTSAGLQFEESAFKRWDEKACPTTKKKLQEFGKKIHKHVSEAFSGNWLRSRSSHRREPPLQQKSRKTGPPKRQKALTRLRNNDRFKKYIHS